MAEIRSQGISLKRVMYKLSVASSESCYQEILKTDWLNLYLKEGTNDTLVIPDEDSEGTSVLEEVMNITAGKELAERTIELFDGDKARALRWFYEEELVDGIPSITPYSKALKPKPWYQVELMHLSR